MSWRVGNETKVSDQTRSSSLLEEEKVKASLASVAALAVEVCHLYIDDADADKQWLLKIEEAMHQGAE